MKAMRYRIRIITLVLICALLLVVIWIVRSVWFPAAFTPESPEESAPASDVSEVPAESVTPALQDPREDTVFPGKTASPAENTAVPDPLFNTYGL